MRIRIVIAAVGLVAILGAACSADDPAAVGTGAPSEESIARAAHNDADVTFAQSMILQYKQAIEMARLAMDRSVDRRIYDLAQRIALGEPLEVEQLEEWLARWGAGTEGDVGGMQHAVKGGASGMVSEAEMTALQALSGAEFDRTFLKVMIAHHRGTVRSADEEMADGESPDAVTLAEEIKSVQAAELAEMEPLLDGL